MFRQESDNMNLDRWKTRYTVREFDHNYIPPQEIIEYLANIIQYIPAFEGKIDHIWFELGPDDADIKEWLVQNIFIRFVNNEGIKEHMLPILNAPYVFLAYSYDTGELFNIKRIKSNIGFHAGALLSEGLRLGLDVSQIGCNQGISLEWNENAETDLNTCRRLFKDRFKDHDFNLDKLINPELAMCFGKGLPTKQGYTRYKDMLWSTSKKHGKTQNNMVR